MIHSAIKFAYRNEAARFEAALSDLEGCQRQRLAEILGVVGKTPYGDKIGLDTITDYDEFSSRIPIHDFESLRSAIEDQRTSGSLSFSDHVIRYEPTSGSTGSRKWIPYTRSFLREINRAAQAWMYDIYCTFPEVKSGCHFWSISWIPTELRGTLNTDDRTLFPWWQRPFLSRVISTSDAIQWAPSSAAAWWATKVYLASLEDLSLLSVWSPTYGLNLFREIYEDREQITNCLQHGRWGKFESELKTFVAPQRTQFTHSIGEPETFIHALWPKLALVSAWDQGHSGLFAKELKTWLPNTAFQGKGLWATEGVITIPLRGAYPLAVRSHFYEFRCLSSHSVLPSWKLEVGQELQPILTCGNSFLRYRLNDRVRVTGMIGNTPTFEFLERLGGVDIVGEKLSYQKAQGVLRSLSGQFAKTRFLCLGVKRMDRGCRYYAIGIGNSDDANRIGVALEQELLKVHHYSSARELKQIKEAGAIVDCSTKLYEELNRGSVTGQFKMSPIVMLDH